MIRVTYNHRVFSGTPDEAVQQLKNSNMFTTGETLDDYMKGVSRRFDELTATSIRYDNPTNFIADMVAAGILHTIN